MPRILVGLLPHVKSLIIKHIKRVTIQIVSVKIVTVLLFQQSLHLLIEQHQSPNADFKILFLLCYKIV